MECPKCSGPMWDNRETKKNPRQPDYKCKNQSCGGAIWPAKGGAKEATPKREPLTVEQVDEKRKAMAALHAKSFKHVVENYVPLAAQHGVELTLEGLSALTMQLFKSQADIQ